MNINDDLPSILAEEERGAAAKAIANRIDAIEALPLAHIRARLCADAFLAAGYEVLRLLEGDEATARKLRRVADQIEARASLTH